VIGWGVGPASAGPTSFAPAINRPRRRLGSAEHSGAGHFHHEHRWRFDLRRGEAMTRIGFGIMLAVSIALTSATLTAADDPALIKATFFSHTNDEDKDHDTCVNVTVSSSDGSTLIAHANQRDCSPNDGTQYKDNSDHQFDLEIDAAGVAKSASKGYKVHVCQTTNGGAGHDTWLFHGHGASVRCEPVRGFGRGARSVGPGRPSC